MSYFTDFMLLDACLSSDRTADNTYELQRQTEKLLRIKEEEQKYKENQKLLKQIVFSVSKKLQLLQNSENENIYKYIELFFIMKESEETGISEDYFDELSDKQYFLDMQISMENYAKELVKSLSENELEVANQYIYYLSQKEYIDKNIEYLELQNKKKELDENEKIEFDKRKKINRKYRLCSILVFLISTTFVVLLFNKQSFFFVLCVIFALLSLLFSFCFSTTHSKEYIEETESFTEKMNELKTDAQEFERLGITGENDNLQEQLENRRNEINNAIVKINNDFTVYLINNYNVCLY